MKLYYSPGACSIAVHIMLEELGEPYQAEKVLTGDGSTRMKKHLSVNPKGQVPVLDLEGEVLTEVSAIMLHLTLAYGANINLDTSPNKLVRAVEWMNWLSSGVHAGPVTQCWNTARLTDDPSHHLSIQVKGQARLRDVFNLIEERMPKAGYVLGGFSPVDPCLLGYFRWGNRLGLDMRSDFPNWTAHCLQMLERPGVQMVLSKEELSVWE
ncbi:MAG: glutathione S-transferase N-terminal domain-containing protein [Paracoccaceae bacterium]